MADYLEKFSPDATRDFTEHVMFGAPFTSQAAEVVGFIDPELLNQPLPDNTRKGSYSNRVYHFSGGYSVPRELEHLWDLFATLEELEQARSGKPANYIEVYQYDVTPDDPDPNQTPHFDSSANTTLWPADVLYLVSDNEESTLYYAATHPGIALPKPKIVGDTELHYEYMQEKLIEDLVIDDVFQSEPGEIVITGGVHAADKIKEPKKRTLVRAMKTTERLDLVRYMNGRISAADVRNLAQGLFKSRQSDVQTFMIDQGEPGLERPFGPDA